MAETQTNKQCYQWQKGENYGEVDRVQTDKKIGEDDFFIFESGRLINKKLIEEFLVEIPSLDEPMFMKEEALIPEQRDKQAQQTNTPPVGKNAYEDYPTEDEIANLNTGGKYSMGNADVVPHPDDMPPMQIKQPVNDITAGLHEEGSIAEAQQNLKANDISAGLSFEQPTAPVVKNPMDEIIAKAKKSEHTLELSLKVKLPKEAFFDMLDEEFLEENLDNLLNSLINKIKQTDLDEQIKEALIKIYNIETQTKE